MLDHACGLSRRVSAYGHEQHPLSTAPSSGGLNSVRVWLAIRKVPELPSGLYRYIRFEHSLEVVNLTSIDQLVRNWYLQEHFAERVAVTAVLTLRLIPALTKYDLGHYRTLHIDAGIVIQNLYLAATAHRLNCCAVSGFRDPEVGSSLGLGPTEIPAILFAFGGPNEAAADS